MPVVKETIHCRTCGLAIVLTADGWCHDITLAELRVSKFEAELIQASPPKDGLRHRDTFLHQARP